METYSIVDQFILVGLRKSKSTSASQGDKFEAYIKHAYPEAISNSASKVPLFCFPEDIEELTRKKAQPPNVQFTFAFTQEDGTQQLGFCRRVSVMRRTSSSSSLNESKETAAVWNVECLCLLTHKPWYEMHFNLLEIIEERYLVSVSCVDELIYSLLFQPIPAEDTTFHVKVTSKNGALPDKYALYRPEKRIISHVNFKPLFDALSIYDVLCLVSSLLFERRVLLCSNDLHTLTTSIQAAVALLHPFSWQYIYIPVLPNTLLDYCMAPMPFIMGVHESAIVTLQNMPMETVLFVDLDNREKRLPKEDAKLLPDTTRLRLALEHAVADYKKSGNLDAEAIGKAFQSFYTYTFGKYNQFLVTGKDGKHKLDREAFFNSNPSKDMKKFFDIFSKTQMFEQFVIKCETSGPSGAIFTLDGEEEESHTRFQDWGARLNLYKTMGSEKASSLGGKAKEKLSDYWKRYLQVDGDEDNKLKRSQSSGPSPSKTAPTPPTYASELRNKRHSLVPPQKALPLPPTSDSIGAASSPRRSASFSSGSPPQIKVDFAQLIDFDSDNAVSSTTQPTQFQGGSLLDMDFKSSSSSSMDDLLQPLSFLNTSTASPSPVGPPTSPAQLDFSFLLSPMAPQPTITPSADSSNPFDSPSATSHSAPAPTHQTANPRKAPDFLLDL